MEKEIQIPINIKDIPTQSGIYLFKDIYNQIIYIGKAINLRSRVRSYWSEHSWKDRPKLAVLVPQIKDIETIITNNEKEALILEANLIYKHQPKYNVLLKDNKTFPWLAITYGEEYPRVVVARRIKYFKKRHPKAKLFGPYTDSGQMYKILEIINKVFPLRKRGTPLYKDRPCLNYHIGKCLGPCQKLINEADYQKLLDQIELLLKGKHEELIDSLTNQMLSASEALEFEKASQYRDQIQIIQQSSEQQRIISDDPLCNRDIIGIAHLDDSLSLQIFKMRNGKLIGRENYFITLNNYQEISESIFSLISQAYSIREAEDIPKDIFMQSTLDTNTCLKSILISEEIKLSQAIESSLSHLGSKTIKLFFPQRGLKKEQVDLAEDNAINFLQYQQKSRTKQLIALESLKEILNLSQTPINIQCFDISHLQGTEVVASCVHIREGIPLKDKYRKLKITIDQNDDFASMKEAVYRRYKNKIHELPELIVIDGGKGQLNAAIESLKELNLLDKTSIISLAKKEEEIYTAKEKINLPYNSPALHILQRARDEAHRFAVSYNRQRREKSSKKSILDDISGIGPKLKETIRNTMTHKDLIKATPEIIKEKLNISINRAKKIHQEIQKKLDN